MTAIDFTPVITGLVTVIAVLVLLIKSMAEKKKNSNPGHSNDTQTKIDHALIKEKLDNIADTLQRIEDKLT